MDILNYKFVMSDGNTTYIIYMLQNGDNKLENNYFMKFQFNENEDKQKVVLDKIFK